jgi:hypothetical protein
MTSLVLILVRVILRSVFWIGWLIPALFLYLLRPGFWVLFVSLVLVGASQGQHASAGWFWDAEPSPSTIAANQVLERAAEIATEAARTQSGQQGRILEAVEALSSERTNLGGHLQALGELAHRDSAWAAAIQAAAHALVHAAVPMLVSGCVLGVAALALWLTARAGDDDAQLASVLVDELAAPSSPLLLGPKPVMPKGQFRALKHESRSGYESNNTPEQEMPF